MVEIETCGSTFPFQFDQTYEQNFGHETKMTVRQYEVIHLREPESDDLLDLMIRQANLRDAATAAMAGMLGGEINTSSYQYDAATRRARRMAEHLLVEIDGNLDDIR